PSRPSSPPPSNPGRCSRSRRSRPGPAARPAESPPASSLSSCLAVRSAVSDELHGHVADTSGLADLAERGPGGDRLLDEPVAFGRPLCDLPASLLELAGEVWIESHARQH